MDDWPLITTLLHATTSSEECAKAAQIGANTSITFSRVQHVSGCILGAGALLHFVFFNRDNMPSFLDRVARLLLWWMIGVVILHNVCDLFVQVIYQVVYTFSTSPCELIVETWKCLLLRVPTLGSIFAMSGVYLLMTLNAIMQAYAPRRHAAFAVAPYRVNTHIFVFVMAFTSTLLLYVYRVEDMHAWKAYCVASSPRINGNIGIVYQFLFAVDVCCTLAFVLALRKSHIQLYRNGHQFVLERKVQIRGSVSASRYMLTSTLFRVVFCETFLLSSFMVRYVFHVNDTVRFTTIITNLYFIQWYGCALAFLLYCWRPFLMPHNRVVVALQDERLVYFQQLQDQWNDNRITKRQNCPVKMGSETEVKVRLATILCRNTLFIKKMKR